MLIGGLFYLPINQTNIEIGASKKRIIQPRPNLSNGLVEPPLNQDIVYVWYAI